MDHPGASSRAQIAKERFFWVNPVSQEQIIAYIKATYIQQNFSSSAQQIGGTKHAV